MKWQMDTKLAWSPSHFQKHFRLRPGLIFGASFKLQVNEFGPLRGLTQVVRGWVGVLGSSPNGDQKK